MERKRPTEKKINRVNRILVDITAVKQHKDRRKAQEEHTKNILKHNRRGLSSTDVQFKPSETKQGVSRTTHKLNRYIIKYTAYKHGESIEEAQKEYTRKIQREYRARKLKEQRARLI
jgi:hypothetical protein